MAEVEDSNSRVRTSGLIHSVEIKSANGGACTLGDVQRFVELCASADAAPETVVAVQTPDLPVRSGTLGLAAAWRAS